MVGLQLKTYILIQTSVYNYYICYFRSLSNDTLKLCILKEYQVFIVMYYNNTLIKWKFN